MGLYIKSNSISVGESQHWHDITDILGIDRLLGIARTPVKSGGSNTVKSAGKAAKTENKVGSVKHGEKSSTKSVSRASTPIVRGNLMEPF